MKRLSWFTSKKIVLCLAMGASFAGVIYFLPQDASPAGLPPPASNAGAGSGMPKGYQAQALRDPFALNAGTISIAAESDKNANTDGTLMAKRPQQSTHTAAKHQNAPLVLPVLTGIVTGQNTKMAILTYHQSRSYAVNDAVGDWKVTAINADSVILSGPGGQKTLRLGR